jgi:hypothetical protein
MKIPARRLLLLLSPAVAAVLLTAGFCPASENGAVWRTGIGIDYFSRTITWDDKTQTSKASATLIAAREEIEIRPGLAFELAAGLSFSNFNGLAFSNLPISIDYEAGAVSSLFIGAGFRARLLRRGKLEIEGVGRFVSSLRSTKTWALEGFAVEGHATGGPAWIEASLGPRISLAAGGKLVPFVTISGNWFSGSFKMTETLGDLSGSEKKTVRAKGFVEISLGARYDISKRACVTAEAGFLPRSGGVDGALSAGLTYRF